MTSRRSFLSILAGLAVVPWGKARAKFSGAPDGYARKEPLVAGRGPHSHQIITKINRELGIVTIDDVPCRQRGCIIA